MYALSIKQPWAWCLLYGGKDIENRTWKLPTRFHDFSVLLHTGKKPDSLEAFGEAQEYLNKTNGKVIPNLEDLPLGCLLGVVRFSKCVEESSSMWFTGPFGWVVSCVKPFNKVIECKGKLGFWEPVEYVG